MGSFLHPPFAPASKPIHLQGFTQRFVMGKMETFPPEATRLVGESGSLGRVQPTQGLAFRHLKGQCTSALVHFAKGC